MWHSIPYKAPRQGDQCSLDAGPGLVALHSLEKTLPGILQPHEDVPVSVFVCHGATSPDPRKRPPHWKNDGGGLQKHILQNARPLFGGALFIAVAALMAPPCDSVLNPQNRYVWTVAGDRAQWPARWARLGKASHSPAHTSVHFALF